MLPACRYSAFRSTRKIGCFKRKLLEVPLSFRVAKEHIPFAYLKTF